jgi:hypothetical protein
LVVYSSECAFAGYSVVTAKSHGVTSTLNASTLQLQPRPRLSVCLSLLCTGNSFCMSWMFQRHSRWVPLTFPTSTSRYRQGLIFPPWLVPVWRVYNIPTVVQFVWIAASCCNLLRNDESTRPWC